MVESAAFSVPVLLRAWNDPGGGAIPLARDHPVISDRSGLVFIRTGYAHDAPAAR